MKEQVLQFKPNRALSASRIDAALLKPQFTALPPLALYVHIPWCLKKCPYCDFNSHVAKDVHGEQAQVPAQQYLQALTADLEGQLPKVWGRRVHAVFIGGGTPSLFTPDEIDALLTMIRARLPLEADAEITLEANPGTFEKNRFAGYRSVGVNRLSIGVQSFNTDHLRVLGRVHSAQQAHDAIAEAKAHFDNFNLDLMFALPHQTIEQAQQDLMTALAYKPPHLSLYHLTIEPDTAFALNPPSIPEHDDAAQMHDVLLAQLESAGYDRYEVSAFARRTLGVNRQSKHNNNYWHFGDYIGIGAGAHQKLSFHDRIEREQRVRHPQGYMEAALAGQSALNVQTLQAQQLPFEFMLNALRLRNGVPLQLFHERCGVPYELIESTLKQAIQEGLLHDPQAAMMQFSHSVPWLCTTERGYQFLNELIERFLD